MLSAIGSYIDRVIPFGHVILRIIYLAVSFALVSAMFAAIYKVLPDCDIAWRDVRLRRRHGGPVHHREIPDQPLYRQQRHCNELRRGGVGDRAADMALLFRADFPGWG